jgi:AcrR family transcriptional regulator
VEVHAVGARALEHQQQTLDPHERLVREILDAAPYGANVPDTTVKAIVAGTRGMIQHHIAAGRPAALLTLVQPIQDWVLSYHTPHDPGLPEPLTGRRRQPARLPRMGRTGRAMPSTMSPRERIMQAVAALSCENGYGALRMPLITAAAGVSNQTFYEHFANKHDAFMACYDRISRRALTAVLASFQAAPDWPRAIRASLETLLSFIAAEPEFARLALFEVLAAGPEARMRVEARTETFTAMMTPGSPTIDNGSGSPRLLGALVAGGAWGVIQHHIIHGRTQRLAELTPNLTYMGLAPFVGATMAAEVARGD